MPAIPNKKYQVIYADPPWPENDISKDKRTGRLSASKHYNTMLAEDIIKMSSGVKKLSSDNSILFLWSTPRHLPLALQVMQSWGFKFVVVGFTWMKKNKNNENPFFGMGYYTRSNAEFCLLGRKGSLKPSSKQVSSALYLPRGLHSEKPIEVRHRIERLFPNVNKLELFAREEHLGWDVWGDQVKSNLTVSKVLNPKICHDKSDLTC